uniref:Leucine rich repeat containing 73 n=1 Tax=Mesocestoides corti TaxID=53468 RepID=A0A5K3EYT0_MESCO
MLQSKDYPKDNMEHTSEPEVENQSNQNLFLVYGSLNRNFLHKFLQSCILPNRLVFLDISGNRVGDEGACQLAKALRTNRSIKAVCLCSNLITDIGVEALCEVVTAFSLTEKELETRRNLQTQRVQFTRRGHITKKGLPFEKKKGEKKSCFEQEDTCKSKELSPYQKENFSFKVQTVSSHPLLAHREKIGPFATRIRGNYQVAMINLSRNKITDRGLKLLSEAVSLQTTALSLDRSTCARGLTDILIKSNMFDEDSDSFHGLLLQLRRKDVLLRKPVLK